LDSRNVDLVQTFAPHLPKPSERLSRGDLGELAELSIFSKERQRFKVLRIEENSIVYNIPPFIKEFINSVFLTME